MTGGGGVERFDVIVVGGRGAGLAAAIEARASPGRARRLDRHRVGRMIAGCDQLASTLVGSP